MNKSLRVVNPIRFINYHTTLYYITPTYLIIQILFSIKMVKIKELSVVGHFDTLQYIE